MNGAVGTLFSFSVKLRDSRERIADPVPNDDPASLEKLSLDGDNIL
jgi:hypothetical protein